MRPDQARALPRPPEIRTAPPGCPDGSAGRTHAAHWCPARPRPPGRWGRPASRHPSPPACRCFPSQAAGNTRPAAQVVDHRAAPRGSDARRPDGATAPPAPASQACSAQARPRRNAGPSLRRRPETRKTGLARWRSSTTGQSAPRPNSARRPNPRTRTHGRRECRTALVLSAAVDSATNWAAGSFTPLAIHARAVSCIGHGFNGGETSSRPRSPAWWSDPSPRSVSAISRPIDVRDKMTARPVMIGRQRQRAPLQAPDPSRQCRY